MVSGNALASSPAQTVELQSAGPYATEVLSITPEHIASANTLTVRFAHRASSAVCNFEVEVKALRLPQKGDQDDYTEALPDGSYVQFANFQPQTGAVKELSVDVSSKRAKFAAVTVPLPQGIDPKACRLKSPLELVFFGK